MPLYRNIDSENFKIAIWRIEEELAFFESQFNARPDIQNENKRLQWYATRHLVNEMSGNMLAVHKDEAGKPYLKNSESRISISHTAVFAAVILGEHFAVGIDLEMVNPKVERIAHKFLRDDEIEAIHPDEKVEKLILYWSAKEALYKLHGKKQLEFKTQLLIEPFELKLKGELSAKIVSGNVQIADLKIPYEFFEDHVMSYVYQNRGT